MITKVKLAMIPVRINKNLFFVNLWESYRTGSKYRVLPGNKLYAFQIILEGLLKGYVK